MRKMLIALKVLALLVAILAITIGVVGRERSLELAFGPIDRSAVDFATLELTEKPNQFLVCPAGFCKAVAHMTSPEFDMPATDLRYRWQKMIAEQPRIEMGPEDEALLQYDYIQRTSLVRYPDSITVRFIELEEGRSTLAIYSRSHYGKSDFGVNEARIRDWLAQLIQ